MRRLQINFTKVALDSMVTLYGGMPQSAPWVTKLLTPTNWSFDIVKTTDLKSSQSTADGAHAMSLLGVLFVEKLEPKLKLKKSL